MLTTADLLGPPHDGAVGEIYPAERPKRRTFTVAERSLPISTPMTRSRRAAPSGALSGQTSEGRAKRTAEQVEFDQLRLRCWNTRPKSFRTQTALEITGKCTRP
jgi:hypothetical protein